MRLSSLSMHDGTLTRSAPSGWDVTLNTYETPGNDADTTLRLPEGEPPE